MSDFVTQNLMLLLQHHPTAAKGLQEHLCNQREENQKSPYQIRAAKNGQPCLFQVNGKQNNPLHSPENPMQEMVAHMQPHMAKQSGFIVLYSIGLGYALQALKNWMQSNRLVIIEPDYDILFEFLRMTNWNQVLTNPAIHIFSGENAVRDTTNLFKLHPSLPQKKLSCFAGRRLLPNDEKQFEIIQNSASEIGTVNSATESYAIICGDAHEKLMYPFVDEAKQAGFSICGIHRPAYINKFLANENVLHETLGDPLPKQLVSFTKNSLRLEEWNQLSNEEVESCIWCYDDPFRGVVDENFFAGLSTLFCYDPFITEKLKEVSPIPVKYLPAATAFDGDTPKQCETLKGKSWELTFVGSTGLQRHEDVLTQLINTNHPVYQKVQSLVEMYVEQGKPVPYDELLQTDSSPLMFSQQQKTVYLQDLATFIIRRTFLSALQSSPMHIFGDRGWCEERWVSGLSHHYAGQSLSYDHESPYVYANSKINLNLFNIQCVNSPTIRMFDVMACGGFLLTEYRPFMDDFFSIGEHLDVFHSREELMGKVNYYLSHEEERKQIAAAGKEFVLNHHRYRHRIPLLFQTR